MADNVAIRDASGATVPVSSEEVTNLNGGSVSAQQVQRMLAAIRTRDGYAIDLPGDASNGLDVDVTRSALPTGAATEAKQDTLIAAVDGVEGALGTTTDASATGDGSVIAVLKRLRTLLAGGLPASLTRSGNLSVAVAEALPAGTNSIGQVDPRGNAAHDAADSGNPVKVGARARTALVSAVSQDDRVDAMADKFGRQLALVAPLDQRRSGTTNFTNNSGADVIAAPGSNLAIVVTRILVVNGHASVGTKVSVRDGTTVKVTGYAAALGGGWTVEDPNGLFIAAANTAVTAICGTTGADVDVTVFGYLIPA